MVRLLGTVSLLVALDGVARADACLGGGGPPDKKDATAPIGARSSKPPLRFAGGGLVFVAALGSVWLVARKKDREPPRE
jgi:hypothetical protein